MATHRNQMKFLDLKLGGGGGGVSTVRGPKIRGSVFLPFVDQKLGGGGF